MRISVIGGFEAGSQKAHAINTVKMAQGFSRLGHEVSIICRQSEKGESPQQLANIYGLKENLKWLQVPSRVWIFNLDKVWLFSLWALPVFLKQKSDLAFVRHYVFPWLSSIFGFQTIAEKHTAVGHQSRPFRCLVRATKHNHFRLWVTISHRLADYYHQQGVPKQKLLVLPDAVDLHLFQRPPELPPSPYLDRSINVAYVGHLYDYKGIPTILETAAKLPEIQFHLVGGLPDDLKQQQQRSQNLGLQNVTFHGLKPQIDVPNFLWHADVLLLPPSQNHPSATWTSPVKLAEYLASETPVVATDIPALRDWLTDEEVEFVLPDNPESMADGIRRLLDDRARSDQLRSAGLQKAQTLSYEKRAAAILEDCGLPITGSSVPCGLIAL